MKMLQPLEDRVLVDLDGDSAFSDGRYGVPIIVPEQARHPQRRGTVLAVGPGLVVHGERRAIRLEPGDRVLVGRFAPFTGHPIELNGGVAYLLREADIVGHLVEAPSEAEVAC